MQDFARFWIHAGSHGLIPFLFVTLMLDVVFVVIVIVVIAALMALRDLVEDDAEDVDVGFLEQGLGLTAFVGADVAAADDEDDAVGLTADDGGVGDGENRRHVEEDVVIEALSFLDELFHLGGAEEFCGVGRHGAARDDVEVLGNVMLNDVFELQAVGEAVRETAVLEAEVAVQHGAAQVAVDEQHALVILPHDEGEVDVGRRFAFIRDGRGEDDGLDFFIRTGKLQIRADGAVGLGNWRELVALGDEGDVCHYFPTFLLSLAQRLL